MEDRIKLSDHFDYKRLFKFVLPSIAMMVFTSVYGVVDGYFVSNYTGKVPFAAVNFIMPFLMILTSSGFMLGAGGSALVAKTLGQGKKEKANQLFSMFCAASVILGFILSVSAFIFMPYILRLMGAEGEMLKYGILYGRIVIIGCIPQMLHFLFEGFIVVAEKPKLGFRIILASGITNILLDYLFVGILSWGVAGAAAATVISQCIGGFTPIIYFSLPNTSLLRITEFKFDFRALGKGCANGSSELMSNISMSLVGMLYNVQLMKYMGEDGVAAYGVIMYVNFIFIAAFIGYSVGTAPIVGFHFGAKNNVELHNILKKSIILLGIGGIVMLCAGEALAVPLSHMYVSYDAELLKLTIHGFRIFSLSFLFCGFAIYGSSFFTALSDGLTSALISFLRTLVFEVAAVMLLPLIIGADGVWFSAVFAEIMAVALTSTFLVIKRKKYKY